MDTEQSLILKSMDFLLPDTSKDAIVSQIEACLDFLENEEEEGAANRPFIQDVLQAYLMLYSRH
jgi:hypothetical protein